MVFSIPLLHYLGQDGQNQVQHNHFSPVVPLATALALCDAHGIINDMIAFLQLKWSK